MRLPLSILAVGALLGLASLAQAQYKYAEPGKSVTYSDQPPPPNAKLLKLNNQTSSATPNSSLPYDLQQAVQNFPVVFYTSPSCAVCDEARNYLRNRGIPHTEKSVTTNEDIADLKRYAPEGTVPALLVGKRKSIGFSTGSWGDLLTDAGYPATSKLPRDYVFAQAENAAPAKASEPVKGTSNTSSAPQRSPQAGAPSSSAPPGFKF